VSTELATTQPVRRPGTPAPVGGGPLPPDKLGLTLRERLWLTRAALATIVLSVVASAIIVRFIPGEVKVRPPDAIAERLQREAEQPAVVTHPAPELDSELPAGEVHRAVPVEPEEVAAPVPAVAAEVKHEPSKAAPPAAHKVQILRNQKSKDVATWPVVEEAVRLDVPQPLSPKKVEYIEHPKAEPAPEPKPAPVAKPAPKPEPAPDDEGLKRPSFE
jgi:hypothetical protein